MSSLLKRVAAVISAQQAEIASLKDQLAVALADDAADAADVANAQAAAETARIMAQQSQDVANRLQQELDAHATEDQAISDLLAPYEAAAGAEAEAAAGAEAEAADEAEAEA